MEDSLRRQLDQKVKEMMELNAMFKEIKTSYDTNCTQIESYKRELDTLKTALQLKNDQLEEKNDQLNKKGAQIESLIKTLEEKNNTIASKVDKSTIILKENTISQQLKQINELSEKIKKYEVEMGYLKEDIDAADKEVENLTEELKKVEILSKQIGILSRSQIIKSIKQLLTNAVHNVSLCIPSILDLAEVNLFDIKASVNVKITCDYDPKNKDHKKILDQYLPLENLSFREYDGKDRWCATQDGDAFFLAVIGKDPNIYLSILTTDPIHLKFFNSIAMESWLRGKKM